MLLLGLPPLRGLNKIKRPRPLFTAFSFPDRFAGAALRLPTAGHNSFVEYLITGYQEWLSKAVASVKACASALAGCGIFSRIANGQKVDGNNIFRQIKLPAQISGADPQGAKPWFSASSIIRR